MSEHASLPTRLGTLRLDQAAGAVLENLQARPYPTTPDVWEVTSSQGGRAYKVNLADASCTCKAGQQSPPTPCKHVALAMLLALTGAESPRRAIDHTHHCPTCEFDVACYRQDCRPRAARQCSRCRSEERTA